MNLFGIYCWAQPLESHGGLLQQSLMEVNNHGFPMNAGVGKRRDVDGMGNENSLFSKSDGTLESPHIKFT